MGKMFYLTKRAQTGNRIATLDILQNFDAKMKWSLHETNYQERDDLSQELKLKIIEVIHQYDLDSIPGFWEFQEIIEQKDN